MNQTLYFLYDKAKETRSIIRKLYAEDQVCLPLSLNEELLSLALQNMNQMDLYIKTLLNTFNPTQYACPARVQSALTLAQNRLLFVCEQLRLINEVKQSKDPCQLCYADELFSEIWQYDFVVTEIYIITLAYEKGGPS